MKTLLMICSVLAGVTGCQSAELPRTVAEAERYTGKTARHDGRAPDRITCRPAERHADGFDYFECATHWHDQDALVFVRRRGA